ncbi:MAG: hypothetical protein JWN04_1873 [Myxococcaceae bacterium]|nr:hypothetical protein [Myxococcaceae bacterium]
MLPLALDSHERRASLLRREKQPPTGSLQLALLLVVAGCYSSSLLQEPKPLPPGKVRGAIGLEIASPTGVSPAVGARIGLAPRTELRGKLSGGGGEIGINVQAVDSKVFDLMLMPSFIEYDIDDAFDEYSPHVHMIGFALPIVASASLDEAEQVQLFFGPDLRFGKRNDAAWSAVGVHVGAAIAGPYDHGTFIPECAFLQGVMAAESASVSPAGRTLSKGTHTISCSLGVTLGGSHQR